MCFCKYDNKFDSIAFYNFRLSAVSERRIDSTPEKLKASNEAVPWLETKNYNLRQ